MSPHSLLLLFSLLPLIACWNFSIGYRECFAGCCYYSSYNTSLDYNCTSPYCQAAASNTSCSFNNTYPQGFRECSNITNCCYYSTFLTSLDYYCQGTYCFNNADSSSCFNTYLSGYRSCIHGCCLYEVSRFVDDYNCTYSGCSSTSSSNCPQNTTSNISSNTSNSSTSASYSSGYRKCISGCCYYSKSGYSQDYYCMALYCFPASSSYCSSSGGSSSGGSSSGGSLSGGSSSGGSSSMSSSDLAAWEAEILTQYSGKTYIVVVYPAWKAFVAIGSIICGLCFFLDIYLIYYKCFHKPRGMAAGPVATNNQQNLVYQPNAAPAHQQAPAYQQPPANNYEMGIVPPDTRN